MPNHLLVLSRKESRMLDQQAILAFGVPSIILMENAGRGVADFLLSKYRSGTVLICCGKGNNAGDGLVVARHLDNHHIPVNVLLFSSPDDLTEDAKINYNIAIKCGISVSCYLPEDGFNQTIEAQLMNANWIVDALFGTGLTGEVRTPYDKIISGINASSAKILSIDIPSGLDCDSGLLLGIAVKADYTLTLVALKKGFVHSEARMFLGEVQVIDIGIPRMLLAEERASI